MKKANKILMASVAILLSLVLITTSVLSGVFAKFAIRKNTTTTMKLEKFGVTLALNTTTGLEGKIVGESSAQVNDGESITVTVSNAKIGPGDFYYIFFDIDGTPICDTYMKISVDIDYTPAHYSLTREAPKESDSAGETEEGETKAPITTYYMPIGFTFDTGTDSSATPNISTATYVSDPWKQSTSIDDVSATALENSIATDIKKQVTAPTGDKCTVSDNTVTLELSKGIALRSGNVQFDNANVRYMYMGFAWPFEHGDTDAMKSEYDELCTDLIKEIKKNSAVGINVTYTITLEQKS